MSLQDDLAAALVAEHIAAFNAHDTERLISGLAEDAVWATGQDVEVGHDRLRVLFDDWLWSLDPRLEIDNIIARDSRVAAQLRERLSVDGKREMKNIAAFFEIVGDKIQRVKVYREGSADIS
jgi:hypothetical protein